ncbi:hypothetical protein [Phytoactinopolyspora endophytica]|uniref:hypothetical protein n=1 Tax=Phytoactinopolyspora endophytica TaxID=1642495 RepID=UPI00101C18A8|nr:hypothetical protein [Phytoactinopolyspora endophytica]
MDVWRITIAALRRWYILLPLLAVTGVLVSMAGKQTNPEYEAQSVAMVAPERVPAELYNPFSNTVGAQQALGIILNSTDTARQLAGDGLSASYEIGADARSNILQIVTRADSPGVAQDAAGALLDIAITELETRQNEADIPERSQYTLDVLAQPEVVGVVETSQLRTQAVVGALGAGLAVLISVLFDDALGLFVRARARRRRRKEDKHAAAIDDENRDQLTLDDIPIVDDETAALDGPVPLTVGASGEKPRQGRGADSWSPPLRRPNAAGGPRSHVSLLSEVEAERPPSGSASNSSSASRAQSDSASSSNLNARQERATEADVEDDDNPGNTAHGNHPQAHAESVAVSTSHEEAPQRGPTR